LNPRRGKKRELNEAIGEALLEATAGVSDDDDDLALEPSSEPPAQPDTVIDPLPDMVRRVDRTDTESQSEQELPPATEPTIATAAKITADETEDELIFPLDDPVSSRLVGRANPLLTATPGHDPTARRPMWNPGRGHVVSPGGRSFGGESSINVRAGMIGPDVLALTPTPAPRRDGVASSLMGSGAKVTETLSSLLFRGRRGGNAAAQSSPGGSKTSTPQKTPQKGKTTSPPGRSKPTSPPGRTTRSAQAGDPNPLPRPRLGWGLPARLHAHINRNQRRAAETKENNTNKETPPGGARNENARRGPKRFSGLSGVFKGVGFGRASRLVRTLKTYTRAIAVVVTMLLTWWLVINLVTVKPNFSLSEIEWYGWDHMGYNLDQFIPFSISRGLGSSDGDTGEYLSLIHEAQRELVRLRSSSKTQQAALYELKAMMPKVIHIDVNKKGKPVIADDFWHALRDLIRKDDSVVKIEKTSDGYKLASDKHWAAVRDQINADIDSGKIPKSWERWLKSNSDKIAKVLKIDSKTSSPPASGGVNLDDIADDLDLLIKEKLKNPELTKVLLTRDEFVRLLKPELATHRQQIKAEMKDAESRLEKHLEKVVQKSIDAKIVKTLSSREIKKLVDEAVRKAFEYANLDGLANQQIFSSWDKDLRNRVNFFSIGNGATIDVQDSSPTYNPPSTARAFGGPRWLRAFRTPPPLGHSSVFQRWEDDGDAWCGASGANHDGRPIPVKLSIQLGRLMTPEYVVIEHIPPGATLEPNARPKEIEIWAYIDGVRQQQRLLDFATTHFPDRSRSDSNLSGGSGGMSGSSSAPRPQPQCNGRRCFFQIGRFEYDSSNVDRGVYVYKLSDELMNIGVTTDHIRVVARSNHGDMNKTCFYRVRLYGDLATSEDREPN